MQRLIDASAAVEHNMELLTMPLTSGAGVSMLALEMYQDILIILCDIN